MRQTIEVDVLATSEATVVEVRGGTYLETNPAIVAQGAAKKHPNDSHDPEIGHALAIARALHALAESYEKRAQERIEHPQRFRYATGGMITTPKFTAYDAEKVFDQTWLDRVLGRGIAKS